MAPLARPCRARGVPPGSVRGAGGGAGGARRERLELLEHHLELVLGTADLASETLDVGAPGESQVAHERRRIEAELRDADHVLGRAREQLAERVSLHEALGGGREDSLDALAFAAPRARSLAIGQG